MKPNTNARKRAVGPEHGAASNAKKTIHIPLRAANAKRSVQNILQWNCYLPADCVKTALPLPA